MKCEVASVEVVLAHETLAEWCVLVGGIDAVLKLPQKLSSFTHELLGADDCNFDALVGEGFGIVGSMKIDLLINRPRDCD